MKSKVRIKKKPDKALKELEKLGKRLEGKDQVLVGLPKNSNAYPDGTSVIMVGLVHELGSPSRGIPERSYLRYTINKGKREYKALSRRLVRKIIKGQLDIEKALAIIGVRLETDVKRRIYDLKSPPLKYREGNPLIDTGHLRQSIVYEIRRRDDN